jgi:hypothetical protein
MLGLSALCQKATYAVQQSKRDYSITPSARASRVPAGETRVFVPDVQ